MQTSKNIQKTSRFISLILRHKPDAIGVKLDEHGWANVDELINGISKTNEIDMKTLEYIVSTDNKQRYSFNDDKTKIRANQGHSIKVDVGLKKQVPNKVLYHGTGEKYVESINKIGLIPKSRLYVHLSNDIETVKNVGKAVVYEIDTDRMVKDGYEFFISENKIWLTKEVPVKYIKKIEV